jgi:secreted Zn-dependent insulinase-like peptidase
LRGVLAYKVKVISKNSCSQYLIQRVEENLVKMKEIVYSIDEKKFEDLKNIVLLGVTSESADFDEEFENDWVQLSRNELDFKRGISSFIFLN